MTRFAYLLAVLAVLAVGAWGCRADLPDITLWPKVGPVRYVTPLPTETPEGIEI